MLTLSDLPNRPTGKKTHPGHVPLSDFFKNMWSRELYILPNRLSAKSKEYFYAELSMLLNSGIDLKTGLQIIREGEKQGRIQKIFGAIYDQVVAGKSFHESLQSAGQFSPYETYSVKIGEESGRLPRIIRELSLYYSERVEQRRKIVSAFSYPAVVVFVAIAVILFMVEFIVPMFEGVFARFGRDLPLLTRWVLAGASFLRENMPGFAGIIVVLTVLFLYVRNKYMFKMVSTRMLLKTPVIGKLLLTSSMHRFCQTMALLTGAGIPLMRATGMVREMISFIPLQHALQQIEKEILHGLPLHASMARCNLFDRRMCTLIKLGEEINGLETAFDRLALQYKDELTHRMELMNKLLEPLLIILIGSLVAIILIAMYLPMFTVGNSLDI